MAVTPSPARDAVRATVPKMIALSEDVIYGDIWERPNMSKRDRSLFVIAALVATYRPDDRWAFTLAARYSSRVYATIDNSDPVTHTYQGFDDYLVFDARVNYQFDEHWNASLGVDNFNDQKYFLFHPFPQRTFIASLKATF